VAQMCHELNTYTLIYVSFSFSAFIDQQDRKTVTRSLSPVQRRSRGGYRGNGKGRISGRGGFYGSEQTVPNYYMDFNGM